MKNFPHQFSSLDKLTSALEVAQRLIASGKNLFDDEVFGANLVQERIYKFRNRQASIQKRLIEEKRKPTSSQGFRTAARDIRRFFIISGLVHQQVPKLLPRGEEILLARNRVSHRNYLWRNALLQMELQGPNGRYSYPYRILLRLIDDNPGIETAKLMLALEAEDNSDREYERISALIPMTKTEIIDNIGVTPTNARNAVKILPALAEQLGDIQRIRERSFGLSAILSTEDGLVDYFAMKARDIKAPRPIDPNDIAEIPNYRESDAGIFDLTSAIAVRKKRTIEHNHTVKNIAKFFSGHSYSLYEFPYDCLARKEDLGGFLIEVKTLDGSPRDERMQSEKALGQLRGYRHYVVPQELKTPTLLDVIAYSCHPSPSAVCFALKNDILPVWRKSDHWLTSNAGGAEVSLSPDEFLKNC